MNSSRRSRTPARPRRQHRRSSHVCSATSFFCANPNQALSRATLYGLLTNGSGGPGTRPVIVDNKVLRGQLAIIQVYCPDELEEFQQFVDSLQTSTNG